MSVGITNPKIVFYTPMFDKILSVKQVGVKKSTYVMKRKISKQLINRSFQPFYKTKYTSVLLRRFIRGNGDSAITLFSLFTRKLSLQKLY